MSRPEICWMAESMVSVLEAILTSLYIVLNWLIVSNCEVTRPPQKAKLLILFSGLILKLTGPTPFV